jgi:hypothetical protein
MFKPIQIEDMVIGDKYKIDTEIDTLSGIYKKRGVGFLKFVNCKGKRYVGDYIFLDSRIFYQFISTKDVIQWQMERRAVNLIVRHLVGDQLFEW